MIKKVWTKLTGIMFLVGLVVCLGGCAAFTTATIKMMNADRQEMAWNFSGNTENNHVEVVENTELPIRETEQSVVKPENKKVALGEYAQTIMIYMVGSDLESEYGNATIDLDEMISAAPDTTYNNVVIYTGGALEWQTEQLSAEKDSILLLNKESGFSIVNSMDSQNMGEADTLASFINFCFDNYESESYSLILWNHGAGPVVGFGMDEKHQDVLTMDEMQQAFANSVGVRGKRLEWVGFDACLMNSLEIADLLAPYANYMVASQETEPGWGWYYGFLAELSDEVFTGEDMGRFIIDYYMAFGEAVFEVYPQYVCDLTMSCVDLKQYQTVEDALNKCFEELDEELTLTTYPELVRKRENTREFGAYSTDFAYGMVDAIYLLSQVDNESDAAREAISKLNNMIVYSRSNMNYVNGISVCYPYTSGTEYADAYIASQEELDFSRGYTGFLKKFYSIQNGEQIAKSWDFSKAETSAVIEEYSNGEEGSFSDISLQLTEEQLANFASADYYILCNAVDAGYFDNRSDITRDDIYMMVHFGKNVVLDRNGVLHGYYGNNTVYVHNLTENRYSIIPMILQEEDRTETEVRYTCYGVLQNTGVVEEIKDWKVQGAKLQIVVNEEYSNAVIRSAIPTDTEGELKPSKQLLDLKDWSTFGTLSGARYYTRGENNEVINFAEWEDTGIGLGIDINLLNEYCLEVRPLENPENYYCVFRIKDVQGNISHSEMIPLVAE